MRLDLDMELVSRLTMVLIISVVVGFLFYSMISYGEKNDAAQSERIQGIIRKALMQCYALEGSYPSEITYLTKYGIVFDTDKYIYYYMADMGNIMPDVKVIER